LIQILTEHYARENVRDFIEINTNDFAFDLVPDKLWMPPFEGTAIADLYSFHQHSVLFKNGHKRVCYYFHPKPTEDAKKRTKEIRLLVNKRLTIDL
jgi:hypothetical protein